MGKGKGKGKGKGGVPFSFENKGPILEEPPLYPMDVMQHLPPAEYPECREDVDLVASHRRLLAFWKTSPYTINSSGRSILRHKSACDLDAQMEEITHAGGVGPEYFPGELMLRSLLKIRGKPTEKSVLEAMRRAENLEGRAKTKRDGGENDDEGKENMSEDEDDDEDEEFGDDDYVADHDDFEDGMGNDFDEADAALGDADF